MLLLLHDVLARLWLCIVLDQITYIWLTCPLWNFRVFDSTQLRTVCEHIYVRVFLIVYIRNMEIILSSCRKMRLEGLLGPPNQTYNVSLIMTWLGRDYSISWRTGFWFILSDFLFYGFLYRWIMFLVCQTYNVSLIMTWLAPDYSIS